MDGRDHGAALLVPCRGGSAGAEDLYGLTPYARHPEWFEDYSTEAGPTRVPARLSITVPVHHFKWHAGVLASAARRLEYYGSVAEQSALPRYAQYSESASILERLQDQRIPIEVRGWAALRGCSAKSGRGPLRASTEKTQRRKIIRSISRTLAFVCLLLCVQAL